MAYVTETPLGPLHGGEIGGLKGKVRRSAKKATILHVRDGVAWPLGTAVERERNGKTGQIFVFT